MDYVELGRRLVACKHFRPMRGMRDVQGRTWDESLLWRWNSACDVPDLTDPATLGCLLALVREAHGAPSVTFEGRTYPSVLHVVCSSGIYHVKRDCGDGDQDLYEDGVWAQNYRRDAYSIVRTSEAEALVAALEVAPDRGEHGHDTNDNDDDDDFVDVSASWRFCEGCGCRKQTARYRSWSDHAWCDECTSKE